MMPARRTRASVTHKGRMIRIEGDGYEFRAEDVEWLNLHRGALERTPRGVKLKFVSRDAALTAYDEIVSLGAANIDSIDGAIFTTDVVLAMVERLTG